MNVKIGIDITNISRFMASLDRSEEFFKDRLFLPQELRQNTKEQLASIFCLKEAMIKALQLSKDSWLLISTTRKENGKVECSFLDQAVSKRVTHFDTSISHEGKWVIAAAIVVLKIAA